MEVKLKKKVKYSGYIVLKTGLHIGGTNTAMSIGGLDKYVVRNPLTKIPYIPGSSLKGKMRWLIEIVYGTLGNDNLSSSGNKAAMLFGTAASNGNEGQPSRLIVRDSEMCVNDFDVKDLLENTDLLYTESKTEVSIDRIKAVANPRTFERVPAGVRFELNMVLNVFKGDDENTLKETLQQAIKLLEDDYLGGQGSRGYGQVKISLDKVEEKDCTDY